MNNINANNTPVDSMQWEAPVLYKEEWIKTLTGGDPPAEVDAFTIDPS